MVCEDMAETFTQPCFSLVGAAASNGGRCFFVEQGRPLVVTDGEGFLLRGWRHSNLPIDHLGSVVSLSFIFLHSPEDKKKERKKTSQPLPNQFPGSTMKNVDNTFRVESGRQHTVTVFNRCQINVHKKKNDDKRRRSLLLIKQII